MSTVPIDKKMTVLEASEVLGVTIQRVHQLLDAYEIPFERLGNLKLIKIKDVNKLRDMDRPRGVHIARKKEKADN